MNFSLFSVLLEVVFFFVKKYLKLVCLWFSKLKYWIVINKFYEKVYKVS